MAFRTLVVLLNLITIIGVYTIYTGGTIASVCRGAGQGVISASLDESGSGTLPGARAWLSGAGRSIINTCSLRR